MRTYLTLLTVLFSLTACGKTTFTIDAQTSPMDDNLRGALTDSVQRVVERRAAAIEGEIPQVAITSKENVMTVMAKLNNAETAAELERQLTRPFSLELMLEASDDEADVRTEQFGGFKLTNINQGDLVWAQAGPDGEQAKAVLLFSETGKEELREFTRVNGGSRIALFVHGSLVSTYQIAEEEIENIIISGIPSLELATIFTDDVVVGIHTRFAPTK